MARRLSDRLPNSLWYNGNQENNLQMAVAALPVSPREAAKPENPLIRMMKEAPRKPILRYKEGSGCPPGYYINDIRECLHPDNFKLFILDVPPSGNLEGRAIVWALDYIRWVLMMEETSE